jgi:hypothetical protein
VQAKVRARVASAPERAKQKAWRDRPESKRRQKEHQLRHNYGLSGTEFDALVASQRGRCASCNDLLSFENKRAHVDHDHYTGQVRGLLCVACNLAEGYLQGSPLRARRLAAYLEKHAPKLSA